MKNENDDGGPTGVQPPESAEGETPESGGEDEVEEAIHELEKLKASADFDELVAEKITDVLLRRQTTLNQTQRTQLIGRIKPVVTARVNPRMVAVIIHTSPLIGHREQAGRVANSNYKREQDVTYAVKDIIRKYYDYKIDRRELSQRTTGVMITIERVINEQRFA